MEGIFLFFSGDVVALGKSNGHIQLWDVQEKKMIRTMVGHEARVATLSWNNSTLSAGSRSGQIIHHDVRVAQHITAVLSAHNQVIIVPRK